MSEELTIYVKLDENEFDPKGLKEQLVALDGVTSCVITVEDIERSPDVVNALVELTLVLTTATGSAKALSALLKELKGVVTSWKSLRSVLVDTPTGPKALNEVARD